MKNCNGEPADLQALAYTEGELPESEAAAFEEHYFDCSVCFGHLQAMQAVASSLAQQPTFEVKPMRVRWFGWLTPGPVWALAGAAAVLVVAVVGLRYGSQPANQPTAKSGQGNAQPAVASPGTAAAARLADLALPAFLAPELRAEREDAHFRAGRTAYGEQDCTGAIAELDQVKAKAPEAQAARFYVAACQMHLGDLDTASAGLSRVALAGDSPQQESALYLLAQISLERGDLHGALDRLNHAISLRGDLEQRARSQKEQLEGLRNQAGSQRGGGSARP